MITKNICSISLTALVLVGCSDSSFNKDSCVNNSNNLKASIVKLEDTINLLDKSIEGSDWVKNKSGQLQDLKMSLTGAKDHYSNVLKMQDKKEYKWCSDFSVVLTDMNYKVSELLTEMDSSIAYVEKNKIDILKNKCKSTKECEKILNDELSSKVNKDSVEVQKQIAKDVEELQKITNNFNQEVSATNAKFGFR